MSLTSSDHNNEINVNRAMRALQICKTNDALVLKTISMHTVPL